MELSVFGDHRPTPVELPDQRSRDGLHGRCRMLSETYTCRRTKQRKVLCAVARKTILASPEQPMNRKPGGIQRVFGAATHKPALIGCWSQEGVDRTEPVQEGEVLLVERGLRVAGARVGQQGRGDEIARTSADI